MPSEKSLKSIMKRRKRALTAMTLIIHGLYLLIVAAADNRDHALNGPVKAFLPATDVPLRASTPPSRYGAFGTLVSGPRIAHLRRRLEALPAETVKAEGDGKDTTLDNESAEEKENEAENEADSGDGDDSEYDEDDDEHDDEDRHVEDLDAENDADDFEEEEHAEEWEEVPAPSNDDPCTLAGEDERLEEETANEDRLRDLRPGMETGTVTERLLNRHVNPEDSPLLQREQMQLSEFEAEEAQQLWKRVVVLEERMHQAGFLSKEEMLPRNDNREGNKHGLNLRLLDQHIANIAALTGDASGREMLVSHRGADAVERSRTRVPLRIGDDRLDSLIADEDARREAADDDDEDDYNFEEDEEEEERKGNLEKPLTFLKEGVLEVPDSAAVNTHETALSETALPGSSVATSNDLSMSPTSSLTATSSANAGVSIGFKPEKDFRVEAKDEQVLEAEESDPTPSGEEAKTVSDEEKTSDQIAGQRTAARTDITVRDEAVEDRELQKLDHDIVGAGFDFANGGEVPSDAGDTDDRTGAQANTDRFYQDINTVLQDEMAASGGASEAGGAGAAANAAGAGEAGAGNAGAGGSEVADAINGA